jgi:hypothetical protein
MIEHKDDPNCPVTDDSWREPAVTEQEMLRWQRDELVKEVTALKRKVEYLERALMNPNSGLPWR